MKEKIWKKKKKKILPTYPTKKYWVAVQQAIFKDDLRINHNRSTPLERSVIITGRDGDLNRFHVYTILALGSAVVHKHTSYSVCVKGF